MLVLHVLEAAVRRAHLVWSQGSEAAVIIAMTAYNRTEYLERVLVSLEAAVAHLAEPLRTRVTIDPSPKVYEVLDLLKEYQQVLGIEMIFNGKRLGLQANTYKSNQWAFELAAETGEDYVVGLPDDILLSPDALRLAAHMRDTFRHNREVVYTSLFSKADPRGDSCARNSLRVIASQHFHCQAWGAWTDTWEGEWKPNWNHDDPVSWDQNVNDRVIYARWQVMPMLSRAFHIGREGTHATEETYVSDQPLVYAGDTGVAFGEYWHDTGLADYRC